MHAEMPGVPECELRMDARVTKCENNTVEDMKRRRLKKGREAGRDRDTTHTSIQMGCTQGVRQVYQKASCIPVRKGISSVRVLASPRARAIV